MPWKIKAEEGGGVDIPDGTYTVRVAKVEHTTFSGGEWSQEERPAVKFTFEVEDFLNPEGDPETLIGSATEKLTPSTKLWAWVEALTGETLSPGQDVDVEGLVGQRALASVERKQNRQGQMWSRITALVPLPKTARQAAPATHRAKPDIHPYEGFLAADGTIDWDKFVAAMKKAAIDTGDLARVMGLDEPPGKTAIQQWVEEEPGRSLAGLIKLGQRPPEEEALPFE